MLGFHGNTGVDFTQKAPCPWKEMPHEPPDLHYVPVFLHHFYLMIFEMAYAKNNLSLSCIWRNCPFVTSLKMYIMAPVDVELTHWLCLATDRSVAFGGSNPWWLRLHRHPVDISELNNCWRAGAVFPNCFLLPPPQAVLPEMTLWACYFCLHPIPHQ